MNGQMLHPYITQVDQPYAFVNMNDIQNYSNPEDVTSKSDIPATQEECSISSNELPYLPPNNQEAFTATEVETVAQLLGITPEAPTVVANNIVITQAIASSDSSSEDFERVNLVDAKDHDTQSDFGDFDGISIAESTSRDTRQPLISVATDDVDDFGDFEGVSINSETSSDRATAMTTSDADGSDFGDFEGLTSC